MDPNELKKIQAKNSKAPAWKGNWSNYDFALRIHCQNITTNNFPLEVHDVQRAQLCGLVPAANRDICRTRPRSNRVDVQRAVVQ
eukprot:3112443-Rhodomonas_salina.1